MLLTVLLQGSSLHETYSEPFQSISFVLGWTNKASTWRTLDSTKMSRLRTCRVVRTLHFEVVCCFVFRHFSRLPTEPCRDMSKYIVLLCLRHNCIMIRIAPISSPWTTRSAQNQAAWNVSQTVKPCQTMSNHVRPFELRETQEDLSRKWGQSRRIPFRADGIVVDCPVDQVLCLWFRGTTPVPRGFAGAPVREPCCQMLFVHCTPDYKIMQSSLLAIATSWSAVQILQGEESSGWRNQTLAIPGSAHPTDRQN